MDKDAIEALRRLNNDFYRANHESFSVSRAGAWPGWERVARHLGPGRLLDVACGNLRFERFLEKRAGAGPFEFTCIDSCGLLVPDCDRVSFFERDVIGDLMAGRRLPGGFDAAVSFGFMHHIPSRDLRVEFIRQLLESVGTGGVAALSFWRFLQDAGLARKARETTERGCAELGLALEEGDCLMGWNGIEGAYRYCHGFSDDEITSLAGEVSRDAVLIDRFNADGRNGAMNGYVVIRRR